MSQDTPLARYRARVAAGTLAADPAQARVAAEFDRLHIELLRTAPAAGWRRWLPWSRPASDPVQGIYLWGSVGRGKTLLMDMFYGGLPFDLKLRMHFHRFMAMIHAELRAQRDRTDPLEHVAARIAERARIICFDEFAVTDIADAMILGNLFRGLFARRVVLAATSNSAPAELYRDGLQRARFLPAIAMIEQHTSVIRMDGELDYRLAFLQSADLFQSPADAAALAHLEDYFNAIAPSTGERDGSLTVLGREIRFLRHADGVIWFDFDQVCDGPRSQDDYIELARVYQSVILSGVPRFTEFLENQARRFIALVDEFYDRRVKLVVAAAVPIAELYAGQRLSREFERTRSRLQEMQSQEYLHAAHRP